MIDERSHNDELRWSYYRRGIGTCNLDIKVANLIAVFWWIRRMSMAVRSATYFHENYLKIVQIGGLYSWLFASY